MTARIWNHSGSTVVKRHSFYGDPFWWAVPDGWFHRQRGSIHEVSPNEDFTGQVFVTKIDLDGTMVFEDLGRENILGNTF